LYPYVVYFSFIGSTSVGTISLLGRGYPHWSSQVQVVKWTADLANGLGADMGVDLGRFGRTVPYRASSIAQVGAILQKMRGKRVPQRLASCTTCSRRTVSLTPFSSMAGAQDTAWRSSFHARVPLAVHSFTNPFTIRPCAVVSTQR
jgi:hypothetical protein